jgi:hypothetical protein
MEQLIVSIIGKLVEYGNVGLAALVIAYLVWVNVTHGRKAAEGLSERDAHIRKLYEDRIHDIAANIKVLAENAVANEKLAHSMTAMADRALQNSERLAQNSERLAALAAQLDRVERRER